MNRTGWYSGDQKPARPGVYEREYTGNKAVLYCYWSGTDWCLCSYFSSSAFVYGRQRSVSTNQSLPWRGLTKESK